MHFIRFPTSAMPAFIDLAMSKNFPLLATTICATGGGAHKFSEQYKTVSVLRLGVVPLLKRWCRNTINLRLHFSLTFAALEIYLNAYELQKYIKDAFYSHFREKNSLLSVENCNSYNGGSTTF